IASVLTAGAISLAVVPSPNPTLPQRGRAMAVSSPHPTLPQRGRAMAISSPHPALPQRGRDASGEIAFGLYNPGVPDDMAQVSASENQVGKKAAILMSYKHWGGAWNNFYAQWVKAVAAHGSVPMITWMSDDYTIAGYPNPRVEGAYSNQRITSGAYDAFIGGWADGLKATGRLILLRLHHEMHGAWDA